MSIFDDLLSEDIENIAELPTYDVPPNGVYRLLIVSTEEKKDVKLKGDKVADIVQNLYKVLEPIELTDQTKLPDLMDDKGNLKDMQFNESFMFFKGDSESIGKTLSALKTNWGDFCKEIGCSNFGQMFAQTQGKEIITVLNRREDKDDKDKAYAQLRKVKLA